MFAYGYAIFSWIEWQVICDTSYILHNMNKLFTRCITKQWNRKITEFFFFFYRVTCNCLLRLKNRFVLTYIKGFFKFKMDRAIRWVQDAKARCVHAPAWRKLRKMFKNMQVFIANYMFFNPSKLSFWIFWLTTLRMTVFFQFFTKKPTMVS